MFQGLCHTGLYIFYGTLVGLIQHCIAKKAASLQTSGLASKNQCQARGLMGSPTVPSSFRLLLSCLRTHLASCASSALISVGAV